MLIRKERYKSERVTMFGHPGWLATMPAILFQPDPVTRNTVMNDHPTKLVQSFVSDDHSIVRYLGPVRRKG